LKAGRPAQITGDNEVIHLLKINPGRNHFNAVVQAAIFRRVQLVSYSQPNFLHSII
jgi:hypothetical protein